MNAIQLFNQSAKKNMVRWDEKDFIKTYPKLYKTIIEAIEKGMEEEALNLVEDLNSNDAKPVLSAVQCEQGYKGDCCCNCRFQVKINKHPINPDYAKGSISETFGYGCEVFRFLKDGSNDNQIIFSENIHGMCEMHCR